MIEIVPPGSVKPRAEQFSFPKMSGLRRSISPRQTMRRRFRNHCANNFGRASFTKHLCVAADPFDALMLVKIFRDGRERSREIDVIAIDVSKNVTGRPGESFVDCMDLTAIFFTLPIRESRFIFTDDVDRLIGASSVDHQILE